jgi:hypothetical protein
VTTTADSQEAFDLIGFHDADAAILDGCAAPEAALELLGDIETYYPSVATFLVGDDAAEVQSRRVRGKWRAVGGLPEDVERAMAPLAAPGSPPP